MKRTFKYFLIVGLLIMISGCGISVKTIGRADEPTGNIPCPFDDFEDAKEK